MGKRSSILTIFRWNGILTSNSICCCPFSLHNILPHHTILVCKGPHHHGVPGPESQAVAMTDVEASVPTTEDDTARRIEVERSSAVKRVCNKTYLAGGTVVAIMKPLIVALWLHAIDRYSCDFCYGISIVFASIPISFFVEVWSAAAAVTVFGNHFPAVIPGTLPP